MRFSQCLIAHIKSFLRLNNPFKYHEFLGYPWCHYPGSSVDLRTIAQEDADDVGLVGPGGQVERRLTPDSGHVGVGLVLDQVDDYVHAAHEAGHVQGRQPRLQTNTYV